MPDADQKYLVIAQVIVHIKNCNENRYSLIEQSLLFQGCDLDSS